MFLNTITKYSMNAKYYPIIKLARQAAIMKRRFTQPIKLFTSGFLNSESYYPELPQKSKIRMALDQLGHIWKYGNIERHYFSYGLDIKGFRNKNDYLDDGWFLWKCAVLNTCLTDHDYTCILRDKELFATLLTEWGYETPHVVACIRTPEQTKAQLNEVFSRGGRFFCKPIDGECGSGTLKLVISDAYTDVNGIRLSPDEAKQKVFGLISERPYLIQTLVEQHPVIDSVYDKSINTLRLVTVFDREKKEVIPMSAVLRVGAHGNTVDNWAKGGLAIGVDMATGTLNEYAFYKQGKGTKTLFHPDSGAIFKELSIPFWEKAINNAKELHNKLSSISVIGWDIAITPKGPLFIEGNDNMEISINQEANGGLAKEFNTILNRF